MVEYFKAENKYCVYKCTALEGTVCGDVAAECCNSDGCKSVIFIFLYIYNTYIHTYFFTFNKYNIIIILLILLSKDFGIWFMQNF